MKIYQYITYNTSSNVPKITKNFTESDLKTNHKDNKTSNINI